MRERERERERERVREREKLTVKRVIDGGRNGRRAAWSWSAWLSAGGEGGGWRSVGAGKNLG
jgi:hypothetical protein